jgi:hypothetical protein
MKCTKLLLTIISLLLWQLATLAQSGSWGKAGNSLVGTEKLGSTNAKPVRFFTTNIQRMTLDTLGQLGLGTAVPKGKLHIFKGFSGVSAPIFNSPLVVESGGSNFVNLLTTTLSASGVLFGNPVNAADGGIIFNGAGTPRGLQFNTGGNVIRMALTESGGVGIGTTVPLAKLHVRAGNSGAAAPNSNSVLIAESAGENFFSLLTPSASRSGLLFGNAGNNADGGLLFNQTRMVIAGDGKVGVGTKTPVSEFHVLHSNNQAGSGLTLQNNGPNLARWRLFAENTLNGLQFISKSGIVAEIGAVTGEYFSVSDSRLKKNIEQSSDVLPNVMRLEVKKYHFLDSKDSDKKHYGMVAQEVEKLFPEIVKAPVNSNEMYTVNYSAYGVIAIKAIQEQQKKIEEQEQTNQEQQQTIDDLRAIVAELKRKVESFTGANALSNKSSAKETHHAGTTNAGLEQNAPNPFNETTVIRYHLPKGSTGQIDVYNLNGSLVKSVKTTSATQTTISGSDMQAGTYTYTLSIDGVIIGSRKMIVMK